MRYTCVRILSSIAKITRRLITQLLFDFCCTTFPADGSDSANLELSRAYGGSSSPLTVIAEAMAVARRERVI